MKQKEILSVVISIFFLVLMYVSLSIYHNAITSTVSDSETIQIAPIGASFDFKTLDALKARQRITADLQTEQTQPSPSPTQKPQVAPSPSIPTTTPEITKAASSSAIIKP
jgi:YbbR domain-containing protein